MMKPRLKHTLNSTALAISIAFAGAEASAQEREPSDHSSHASPPQVAPGEVRSRPTVRSLRLQHLSADAVARSVPAIFDSNVTVEALGDDTTVRLRGPMDRVEILAKGIQALDRPVESSRPRLPVDVLCLESLPLHGAFDVARHLRSADGEVVANEDTDCLVIVDHPEFLSRIRTRIRELEEVARRRSSLDAPTQGSP